jgi:hypothetical protein
MYIGMSMNKMSTSMKHGSLDTKPMDHIVNSFASYSQSRDTHSHI